MHQMQRVGLLSAIGLLCFGMFGLIGCGGAGEDDGSAARVSRVALQIMPADPAAGNTLRQATGPGQPREVPTDPSDPAFVRRVDIRVTGPGITTPITQSVELTADQQEEVTVQLDIPSGRNRLIVVSAFNDDDNRIFGGETTADLLEATATVTLVVSRVLLPRAVTADDLANQAFTFADGRAFGVSGEVLLQFGTFTENTGSFTLTAPGLTASGNITIVPPASEVATRQDEASPSCDFAGDTRSFLMQPCEVDVIDGNLIVVNADTDASSTSAPPVDVSGVNIDITVRDVITNEPLAGARVTINGISNTTDTNGAALFTNVPVGKAAIAASRTDYLTHAFVGTIHLDINGLNLFIYPLTEATVDTDSDGLPDAVETNLKIFLSPLNTGTDPNNKDTDEDELTDGAEVLVEIVLVENQ